MDSPGIALGLSVALSPENLLYCFVGVTAGTLVGLLPGIGVLSGIALLLPLTYHLPPVASMIMLAGIYYGAQYGGSTTSILLKLPGESSTVITAIEGHALAQSGRAGPALAVAAIGSFVAGTAATVIIAFAAPPLASLALEVGSVDYFSLMVLGLVAAAALAHSSSLKGIAMVAVGLAFGLVGIDSSTGSLRFTFGEPRLYDGISLVAVVTGLFGFAHIIGAIETSGKEAQQVAKVGRLMPTRRDFADGWRAVLRGSLLGSLLGVLPGGGAVLSSFCSYALEKRLSKDPSRFGKGAIEGLAGPEAANNAASQTSFIPLLTLGIPPNAVIALMAGALMLQGITPGPNVISEQPELFWGLVASMWIGNLMLLVLNLPLLGVWVAVLRIPYRILYPCVLLFACVGVYAEGNSVFNVVLAAGLGFVGYMLMKLDFQPAPLVLGLILGPLLEENFRRSLVLSRGSFSIFVTEPISLVILLGLVLGLAIVAVQAVRRRRAAAQACIGNDYAMSNSRTGSSAKGR
jgi:putative tricarboxylic transport membrane protein